MAPESLPQNVRKKSADESRCGSDLTFIRRHQISHQSVVLPVLKGSILSGLAINFNGAVGNE